MSSKFVSYWRDLSWRNGMKFQSWRANKSVSTFTKGNLFFSILAFSRIFSRVSSHFIQIFSKTAQEILKRTSFKKFYPKIRGKLLDFIFFMNYTGKCPVGKPASAARSLSKDQNFSGSLFPDRKQFPAETSCRIYSKPSWGCPKNSARTNEEPFMISIQFAKPEHWREVAHLIYDSTNSWYLKNRGFTCFSGDKDCALLFCRTYAALDGPDNLIIAWDRAESNRRFLLRSSASDARFARHHERPSGLLWAKCRAQNPSKNH